MNRAEKFKKLETHPWYSRLFKRLTLKEREFCLEKIEETKGFSDDDFCEMAQRYGFEESEKIFKNYKIINELLLVSGSKL